MTTLSEEVKDARRTGGAMVFDFEEAAEVLNFGAFLAFMGVNLALIRSFYFDVKKPSRNCVADILLPACGFLFCLATAAGHPSSGAMKCATAREDRKEPEECF